MTPKLIVFSLDCTLIWLNIECLMKHTLSKVWRDHESVFVNIITSVQEKRHSTSLSSRGCSSHTFPNTRKVTCIFLLNIKKDCVICFLNNV